MEIKIPGNMFSLLPNEGMNLNSHLHIHGNEKKKKMT